MSKNSIQSRFIAKLAEPLAIQQIFEWLPDVAFFVKDRNGIIISVSASVLRRLGMEHESEFIGRTDADVYPPHMFAAFRADDEWVFQTGRPLVNRLEVWLDEQGHPDWFVTTKVPLLGKDATIVGLMGVSRRDLNQSKVYSASTSSKAVVYVRENIHRIVTTEELAEGVGVSTRTLNRRINRDFGISPYELMIRIRVQASAERLLQGQEDIANIAIAHGFCDQSHFTQHFRKRMGMTPRQFRNGLQ